MRNDVICLPMKRSKKIPPLVKEELTSRIEIQERSLQAYSKEIFENIGQVLSLVKLQLLSFQPSNNNDTDNILDSGKLLGKAIADLRNVHPGRRLHQPPVRGNGPRSHDLAPDC